MKTINVETVAQMCHVANVVYSNACTGLMMQQKSWDELGIGEKKGRIEAIRKISSGEIMAPRQNHDAWMKARRAEGWVYGVTKDEDNKTHPCLVDYDELPEEQRVKDDIFFSIIFGLLEREVEILFPEEENMDAPSVKEE